MGAAGPLGPAGAMGPVSYTHLDVYKRQDPHGVWAVTFFNGEVGNFYSKIPAMYARAVRTAR